MKFDNIISKLKGNTQEDIEVPPKEKWPHYVVNIGQEEFQNFIHKFPVTLIDFHSPTCKPCRAMKPRLRKLAKEYDGKAVFGKVDITKNKNLADKYGVTSVPTIIIFRNGKKKKFLKGKLPMSTLKKSLDDLL